MKRNSETAMLADEITYEKIARKLARRRKPTFGHAEVDYRLREIFERTANKFQEADAADKQLESEYEGTKATLDSNRSVWMIQKMFATSNQRKEVGVVLVVIAQALLEQIINDYAHTFLEPESCEKHLGKVSIVAKWVFLPYICQNKKIQENDPAINSLRELSQARNAIVHRKRKEMYSDPAKAIDDISSEGARFLSACRKATATVDTLVKILESVPG